MDVYMLTYICAGIDNVIALLWAGGGRVWSFTNALRDYTRMCIHIHTDTSKNLPSNLDFAISLCLERNVELALFRLSMPEI